MLRSPIKTFKENTWLRPTPYATGEEKFLVENAKPNTYYSGTVTTPSGKVGVSVRADRKGKGEDFIAAEELTNFHHLSDKLQELAIQASFEIMQRACGVPYIGSTACVVIASFYESPINGKRVKVTVANLGDSFAHFSKQDSKGNWHTKQLNQLHDCNNQEEVDLILQERIGIIEQERLNGVLKTTRGIGDKEQKGLSHTPTFSSGTYSVDSENALLIVSSDGLSDGLKKVFPSSTIEEKEVKTSAATFDLNDTNNFNKLAIEKNISAVLKKNENASSEQLAHNLAQKAFAPGPAEDDTSIGIIAIKDILRNFPDNGATLSVAVFDGHTIDSTKRDGRQVSRDLSMLFYPLLETVTSLIRNNTTFGNESTIADDNIQNIIKEQTESTIKEKQQLFAFRKIYQALYDGQSGLKTSNFLDSPRSLHLLNAEYLESYQAKKPYSRRAKAWQLAKKHSSSLQYTGGVMNVELFKEIYHYSYAKSSILKRSELSNQMAKQQNSQTDDNTAAAPKNFFARTIENIHGFFHSSFRSSTIAAQIPLTNEHDQDSALQDSKLYHVLCNSKKNEKPKTRTDKIVHQFKTQDESKQLRP